MCVLSIPPPHSMAGRLIERCLACLERRPRWPIHSSGVVAFGSFAVGATPNYPVAMVTACFLCCCCRSLLPQNLQKRRCQADVRPTLDKLPSLLSCPSALLPRLLSRSFRCLSVVVPTIFPTFISLYTGWLSFYLATLSPHLLILCVVFFPVLQRTLDADLFRVNFYLGRIEPFVDVPSDS